MNYEYNIINEKYRLSSCVSDESNLRRSHKNISLSNLVTH